MESSAPNFAALSPNIAAVFGEVIPDIVELDEMRDAAPIEDMWATFFSEHRGDSRYPGAAGGGDTANPFARVHPELPWVDRGLPPRSAAPSVTPAPGITVAGESSWEAEVPPLPKAS